MKKTFVLWLLLGLLIGGCVYLLIHYTNSHPSEEALEENVVARCNDSRANHVVTIKNDNVQPVHITASLCDTLTILNTDSKVRLMAFGVHDRHQAYDGVSEEILSKNQSFTITLNQKGKYLFHDHHQDEVAGDFEVQ